MYESPFVVEKILDVRGPPERRFYKVKWKNYELNTVKEKLNWEFSRNVEKASKLVKKFWTENPHLNINDDIQGPAEERRCKWCNEFFKLPDKNNRFKAHQTKGCPSKPQSTAKNCRVGRAVKRDKLKKRQQEEEKVVLGTNPLSNVFDFKYLGHLFQADGDGAYAIEVRMKLAKAIFGRLHEFWSSSVLKLDIKIRIYKCCVWSVLSYGNIAWKLDKDTCSSLRGWNAKCLSRITGKEIPVLASKRTIEASLDLVNYIRAQRIRWLGHTLRREGNHPAKAIVMKLEKRVKGSILMDLSYFVKEEDMEKLVELAHDKEEWNIIVNTIKTTQALDVIDF